MLSRLSLRAKLLGGFGFIVALLVVVGGSGLWAAMRMQDSIDDLSQNWLPSVQVLGRYKAAAMEVRQIDTALLLFREPAARAQRRPRVEAAWAELRDAWQTYEPLILSSEEQRLAAAIRTLGTAYLQTHAETVRLLDANDDAAAYNAFAAARPAFEDYIRAIDAAIQFNAEGSARARADGSRVSHAAIWGIAGVMAAALVLGFSIAVLIGRSIATRIVRIAEATGRMAHRDYAFALPEVAHQDEIGALARSLDTCRDGLKEADRLATQQVEQAQAQAERAKRVDALVKSFEAEASGVLRAVSSAATELSATAGVMTETAEDGTRQAAAVAAASEQASTNVQTVAASTEELAASISEVARQVRDTAAITNRAADAARATDGTVRGLAEAANKIGDVVRLINDIAGQTNLLALNATIEAARAGEAGKGFAVVASEVKNLASQTAKATEEIAQQITAMQSETTRTVDAIEAIGRTIEELNATTSQVAAASEQQAAATQEIGRAVAEAAMGTQEASRSAAGVKQGAERTGGAAQDLRGASAELAQQSERLRGQVDGFLAEIRAA
ncbi:methyl-accepting chemotaxis protein [Roseomonas sp. CAU 1739]|uniref:methyl-accepting chemotaxis protein n=1 Tax=Roseomonas sp. CAU 1739 TaxID=3140364 RepID=UPI00325BCE18